MHPPVNTAVNQFFKKKVLILHVIFANVCALNTASLAGFRLPAQNYLMQSWEEMHTIASDDLAQLTTAVNQINITYFFFLNDILLCCPDWPGIPGLK